MDNQSCRLLSSFYIATGSLGEENRSCFMSKSSSSRPVHHQPSPVYGHGIITISVHQLPSPVYGQDKMFKVEVGRLVGIRDIAS